VSDSGGRRPRPRQPGPRRPGPRRPRPRPRPGARRPGPKKAKRRPGGATGTVAPDLAHYRYRETSAEQGAASFPEGEDPYLEQQVGPCRVLEFLGEGGAGRVYRAMHERLDFEVALKLITDQFKGREKALERFTREARVSARLNHPNVVRVYDVNAAGASHYIIQELVRGQSLARRVRESGPLSDGIAAAIGRDLASGLASIHAAGIVHRDVKPENVIITAGDAPKLIDFGIAKDTKGPGSETAQGMMLGTPRFMAPEQAAQEGASPAADAYGLGATLYFALTGRAPLEPGQDEDLFAFVQRRRQTPPPPLAEVRRRTHPALGTLIDRMLALEPDGRPSAEEIHRALGQLEETLRHQTTRWKAKSSGSFAIAAQDAGGTQGTFEDLPLPEILQNIEFNEKSGELEIHAEAVNGLVTFKAGLPYEASTSDGRRGEAAIWRLLDLEEGNFVLRRDSAVAGPRQIKISFTRIMLDHSRQSDESGRLPIVEDEPPEEPPGLRPSGEDPAEASPGRSNTLKLQRSGKTQRRVTSRVIKRAVSELTARAWPAAPGDPYLGCKLGPFQVDQLIEVDRGERRYLGTHLETTAPAYLRVFPFIGPYRRAFKALAARASAPLTVKHAQLEPLLGAGTSKEAFYVGTVPTARRSLTHALVEAGGALPPAEVVRIVGAAALALQALHGRSMTHGCLSLRTIELDADDQVVVTSAGLGREDPSLAWLDGEVGVVGDLGYMAPEVLDQGAASPASDVYSLGVVAWTLLAGGHPAGGGGELDLALGLARAEIPPVQRDDGQAIPEGLVTLVTKLTGRNPKLRYANANDFLTELSAYERGKPVVPFRREQRSTREPSAAAAPAPPSQPARKSADRAAAWRRALTLLVLLDLALVGLAVFLFLLSGDFEIADPLAGYDFGLEAELEALEGE